jgi:hypothetical protein
VRGKQKFTQVLFSADEGMSWQLVVKSGAKTLLSKSGSTDTTARNMLAGQDVPKKIGGAKYTLTMTAATNPSRKSVLTGTVAK